MSEPTYRNRFGRMYAQWPTGFVYFATFVEPRDVVKIGWSQNPGWRAVQLSTLYGAKIQVYDRIEIDRGSKHWGVHYGSLEYRIHRELAKLRVDPWSLEFADRGEWYALGGAKLDHLIDTIRRNIAREDQLEAAKLSGATSGPMSSSTSKTESPQP